MNKIKTRREIERNKKLIVPIAFDDIYKVVFGTEENANITAYLISLLLNIPYKSVKGKIIFKSTRHYKKRTKEKNSEKDIVFIVDTSIPLKINLEMNRSKIGQPLIDRNTYFLSNLFGSGLTSDNEYKNLKTTIQFNFNLNFVDKKHKDLFDEYLYRNKHGNVLTEKAKIVHINLYEMYRLWYNGEYKKFKEISPVLFGLAALIIETDKNKFKNITKELKMNKDVKEKIERTVLELNYDDELVTKYYDLEAERHKMYEALVEYEVKEQVEEREKDMITNMYEQNLSIDDISRFTKMPVDKIKEIINKSK